MRNFTASLTLLFLVLAGVLRAQSPEMRKAFARQAAEAKAKAQPTAVAARPAEPPPAPVKPVRPFDPEFSLGLELASKYYRDGWCLNSSPVLLEQAEITESGLYLGIRSTYDFSDKAGRRRRFQDSRVYAGYAMAFTNTGTMGPVVVDFCWSYNTYPGNSVENSGEITLGFLLNEIWKKGAWAITGGLTLSHNYGKNQTYAVTDATLHYALKEDGSLQLENGYMLYWGDTRRLRAMTDGECEGNAFYTAVCRLALNWKIGCGWALVPYGELMFHPDSRAKDAARVDDFNSAATLRAGLSLNWCF